MAWPGACLATGYHLRAKQNAEVRPHPMLGSCRAPAFYALASGNIHDNLTFAVPAVNRERCCLGIRTDTQQVLVSQTDRASYPSVLHDQFTIFAVGFQLFHSLSLGLFTCYTWFPDRIKTRGLSGFRLRGGLAPFLSFLIGKYYLI